MVIEEIMNKIQEEYPEERVAEMLDEEIPLWIEKRWQDYFDDPFEAYAELGYGEAEAVVRDEIINHYAPTASFLLQEKLDARIRETYEILDR